MVVEMCVHYVLAFSFCCVLASQRPILRYTTKALIILPFSTVLQQRVFHCVFQSYADTLTSATNCGEILHDDNLLDSLGQGENLSTCQWIVLDVNDCDSGMIRRRNKRDRIYIYIYIQHIAKYCCTFYFFSLRCLSWVPIPSSSCVLFNHAEEESNMTVV